MRALLLIACVAALGMTGAAFWATNRAVESLSRMEASMRRFEEAFAVNDQTNPDVMSSTWVSGSTTHRVDTHRRKHEDGSWETNDEMSARHSSAVASLQQHFPPN